MAKFPRAPLTYEQLKALARHITDFVDREEVSCPGPYCSETVYWRMPRSF